MKIKQFSFNMFSVNTYIVWDDATLMAAIIDPGMIEPSEIYVIDEFITRNGLKIAHLINTHLHLDHTFGDRHIMNRYGVEIEAHQSDAFLGRNIPAQARAFGIDVDVTPIEIEHHLAEGDVIAIGNETLKVLHVPGHSPGSIILYAPQSAFLIAGDVIFRNSIGRTDLAGGNGPELINGITSKILTLPPETVIYPGHGPATTVGYEANHNPYL